MFNFGTYNSFTYNSKRNTGRIVREFWTKLAKTVSVWTKLAKPN